MTNIEIARQRCEYASALLKEEKIPHQIKNPDIGHINLFYQGKCVMSFWARTGKFIYTVNSKNLNNAIEINDNRGIKKCIEFYHHTFNPEEV